MKTKELIKNPPIRGMARGNQKRTKKKKEGNNKTCVSQAGERASEDDEVDDVDEEGKEEECLPQTFRSRKY